MNLSLLVLLLTTTPLRAQAPANDVRAESRKIVSDCQAQLPDGFSKRVDYAWTAVCNKPSPENPKGNAQGEEAHYTLSKRATGIHLAAKLRLKIEPAKTSTARAKLMLTRARECMADINKYWTRYGVTLDFVLDSERNKTKGTPDYELLLSDSSGRSHSRLHYFQGLDAVQNLPNGTPVKAAPAQACLSACTAAAGLLGLAGTCADACEPVRQKEFCLMMLHEVGHLVGLKDEYADPACPDREFISTEANPWSVMNIPYFGLLENLDLLGNQSIMNFDALEFFPRHLRTIMEQACPAHP